MTQQSTMSKSKIANRYKNAGWAAGLLLLASAVTTSAAEAREFRPKLSASPKDCTRINGRWGYYGNPWCTRAEQLRWDRWDAARAQRLGSGINKY
jgi:hypothetical protein